MSYSIVGSAFSIPLLLLGLLSILFSFGKGLIFFTPGLLLPIKSSLDKIQKQMKDNGRNLFAVYSLKVTAKQIAVALFNTNSSIC